MLSRPPATATRSSPRQGWQDPGNGTVVDGLAGGAIYGVHLLLALL
ncbi:MAG TPA: hypothetical protein VEL75_00590 [Candidatus Methylomirabilis sp.]|nr:hypothetical protein [Candidatus Methylomirabilis sp.]